MFVLKDLLLNTILILFPILGYFVYSCYQNIRKNEKESLVLNITLITSLYLCLTFGNIENNNKILLFCNIPIIIAYLKNKTMMGLILSFFVILYSNYLFDVNIIIIILKYLGYYILYLICQKKKTSDLNFILLLAVFQGFFLSFEYFFVTNASIEHIIELFVIVTIYYLITFLILNLFEVIDHISAIFLTVKELEQEKQIKNSLFKITHEIKNPIAVCKGYIDMIDPQNIAKTEKYIPIIKQELDRSLNIMNDYMEFSKIKLNKELIDINLLLEDVYDGFKLLMKNKEIDITLKDNKEEIYLEGDYNRLKQVLLNLLKNCTEAIDKEGKITIKRGIKNEYYYISIKDTGCGMSKEQLKKVKEMFWTTKINGSGLGVSLSNEIINGHQGFLDYESTLNKGTKVTIRLPLKKDFKKV